MRDERVFFGIDHLEMVYAALFEFLSYHAGEGTYRCFRDISYTESGGVKLVACTHRADERHTCRRRAFSECELACDRVDSINDIVVLCEVKFTCRLWQIERAVSNYRCIRVNGGDTRRGDIHLILPDGIVRGKDLTVDVGEGDFIVVDEMQCTDAAARKRLDSIAADTADTEYRNFCVCQFLHRLVAEQ